MKKNKEKRLPQQQLVKGANEALLEGASQMSGVKVKDIASSMVSGALMSEATAKQKLRRKVQRKMFKKKFQKTKILKDPAELKFGAKVGKPVYIGYDEKDSVFKMKGFSGFGNKK